MDGIKKFSRISLSLAILISSGYNTLFSAVNLNEQFFSVDILTFKSPQQEKTLLEILCEIPAQKLQFVKCADWFSAHYEISIEVQELPFSRIRKVSYRDSITVNDTKKSRLHNPIGFGFP